MGPKRNHCEKERLQRSHFPDKFDKDGMRRYVMSKLKMLAGHCFGKLFWLHNLTLLLRQDNATMLRSCSTPRINGMDLLLSAMNSSKKNWLSVVFLFIINYSFFQAFSSANAHSAAVPGRRRQKGTKTGRARPEATWREDDSDGKGSWGGRTPRRSAQQLQPRYV